MINCRINLHKIIIAVLYSIAVTPSLIAAKDDIKGSVCNGGNTMLAGVTIVNMQTGSGTISNKSGIFTLSHTNIETDTVLIQHPLYETIKISANKIPHYCIYLTKKDAVIPTVMVLQNRFSPTTHFMPSVSDIGIAESKKSEVIFPDAIPMNKAANTARTLYSRSPGLNVWENDAAGIQLNIGSRGLSPHRTSNFNVRQNGYDISADALGYPESYYTPPAEALQRIEIIRGAASLQFGTQFGGMLNFVMKDAERDSSGSLHSMQTIGSFGLFSSYNAVKIKKEDVSFYGYYQHKQGNGWRQFSSFNMNNIFLSSTVLFTDNFKIKADYTYMDYIAQQPGGLTDALFQENPQTTLRARNWFSVLWHLAAISSEWKAGNDFILRSRFFVLSAGRSAVGNLERITVADFSQNRTLMDDEYKNFGSEHTATFQYSAIANIPSTMNIGIRAYHGMTTRKQGEANADSSASFEFLIPGQPNQSNYQFPGTNIAVFAENVFSLSEQFSITPGFRAEYIATNTTGNYITRVKDFAGNIISEFRTDEQRSYPRNIFLMGLGASWRPKPTQEWYANISQNYRSITFSDMRIVNPNILVDSTLRDETGFTVDLGFRGNIIHGFFADISLFAMKYNNRIGTILRNGSAPLYLPYRYRTNIADAATFGCENYLEFHIEEYISLPFRLHIFNNFSIIDAKYLSSDDPPIQNKSVELVSPFSTRTGFTIGYGSAAILFQYNYMSSHYSDATNAERSSTAVIGIIPSYSVADISMTYSIGVFRIEAAVNNIFNARYFTRRAEGYPGPGIIPADPLNIAVSVGALLPL